MIFHEGELVVCIDASDTPLAKFRVSQFLTVGLIYTIEKIHRKEDNVELFEVPGKKFKSKRFRPLNSPIPNIKSLQDCIVKIPTEEELDEAAKNDNFYVERERVAANAAATSYLNLNYEDFTSQWKREHGG